MDEDAPKARMLPDGSLREISTGRFVRGTSGRAGAGHTAELRKALSGAVTVKDIHDITRKVVSLAKEGDTAAVKLLWDRLFGKLPNNLKLVEERNLSVNIRNLSPAELDDLERLALRATVPDAIEAEAVVKESCE